MAAQALAANGDTPPFTISAICFFRFCNMEKMFQHLTCAGAKVYITGRRMEVLENAARNHSPD